MHDYTRNRYKIRDNKTEKIESYDSVNKAKKASRQLQKTGSTLNVGEFAKNKEINML
jgi:hypothetical protein